MNSFNRYNNVTGWLVFATAAFTYLSTIEPTASFWDCGEFIATAYKLEVGHPPGAPLFMLIARFFSLFSFGDTSKVAVMVNTMSGLASAFTILFLFWSITHIARKAVARSFSSDVELNMGQTIAVLGSGLVGALAYAWSDTFWFSAVEGEVYALSSLFTAVVFWAILKWENVADEPYANRWIVLIAYLMGLSIGVHLLNLLAIPAIVFIYYFRKYKVSVRGIIVSFVVSVFVLAAIQYGIIQGIVKIISKFELFAVNSLGMPYNGGLMLHLILLLGSLAGGLYYTYKGGNTIVITVLCTIAIALSGVPLLFGSMALGVLLTIGIGVGIYYFAQQNRALLNTVLSVVTVIIIGYSSFSIIMIRSYANPPIDENNPEHPFALLSYLNREQYGNRPLGYGPYYNAPVVGQKENETYYPKFGENGTLKDQHEYVKVLNTNPDYEYDDRFQTIFPRMYSSQASHESAYKSWAMIEGTPINIENRRGEQETIYKPTFGENLLFFFGYQVNHMYLRYFMWNFAGRQNDSQGHGNIFDGNWISGISFLDEIRLGNQDKLPKQMTENKARNKFYFLPLLLGIAGILYLLRRSEKDSWVVFLLFFFTGIAIVLYLNQTPYQPRERDYAYAASFYAFAFWIGLGVMWLYEFLNKYLKNKDTITAGVATALSFVAVPSLMVSQTWDDHDRSGRYTALSTAKNYLNSCAPNAILFTFGDNDTFPLWYAQEVEGIRTDVRVVNLSLLSTDWYGEQMKRQAYNSAPLPFSLTFDKFVQGKRDVVYVVEQESVMLEEKWKASRPKLLPQYQELYEKAIPVIEKSKFPELHKDDFARIAAGYDKFSGLTFAAIIGKLAEKANIDKYALDADKMAELNKLSEALLTNVAKGSINLEDAITFIASDDAQNKLGDPGDLIDFLPTRNLRIPVDVQKVLQNGTVAQRYANKTLSAIEWKMPKSYLGKNDLFVLDFLAHNNWERPVYFATSASTEDYLGLDKFFQLEGYAYRLVPVSPAPTPNETGFVNSDTLFNRVMERYEWGRMEQPDFFMDEQNLRTINILNLREMFTRLAKSLNEDNKKDKAIAALDRCCELMPGNRVPYDYFATGLVEQYYKADAADKANALMEEMCNEMSDRLYYYLSLNKRDLVSADRDIRMAMYTIQQLIDYAADAEQKDIQKKWGDAFATFQAQFQQVLPQQ